ncbi:uncharacterized protein LOC129000656 [Macrosteles quadrilineatus]|uniref:uncharacterized protein LOC129000656 n=1 Tax=Macrosteles quadrilineatus TaxID=74068 RepID=UPI0023E29A9D|nr:uncharacterized protein LOC129000656 [Macrosteles quadrilineatus]
MIILTSLLVYLTVFSSSFALRRCSQTHSRHDPWYLLLRTCSMSTSPPLDEAYLQTVEDCERFASKRKAMAFNFVRPEDLQIKEKNTCILYECPEMDEALLEDNSMYDYYGIYRDLDIDSNVTCILQLGMFHLHSEGANYTEAVSWCEGEGAQLARVTTVVRTTKLSTLVATLGPTSKLLQAYVGLNDISQEGFFVSVEDEPLNCFDYRAWAPGHPRSRPIEDCVVLDSRRGWRTVDCTLKLPFICELIEPVPELCGNGKRKKAGTQCRSDEELKRRKQHRSIESKLGVCSIIVMYLHLADIEKNQCRLLTSAIHSFADRHHT